MHAHNPTRHRTGTHSVRHTCIFMHVHDEPASPSGVVSVSPAVSHGALPRLKGEGAVCVKTSPLRCRMCS